MSTTLLSLSTRVQRLIGDTDADNPRWEQTAYVNALDDSVSDFNYDPRTEQEYEVLGTSNARYYNPTPDGLDTELLVCYAGLILLTAEMADAARRAISYSNSGGSTNLTAMPSALEATLKRIKYKIDDILANQGRYNAEAEMAATEITTQE
jgi:hypothetical protein